MQQLAARPGLLSGEAFESLQASNHFISYTHDAIGIRSLLTLAVESCRGYTTLILLGNPQPCGFLPEHLTLLQTLSPQIQLSLDNLFAFEDLARQEYEKEVHLAITNIFTSNRFMRNRIHSPIGELVTEQINRLVPLEVSLVYVTHPTHPEKDFVAGHYRSGDDFTSLWPEVFMQQFGLKPGHLSELTKDWRGLFEASSLYVGEAFDALCKQSMFMQMVCRHFGIRSLLAISLDVPDRTASMLFVGSKHPYAYQESDAAILKRLAPQINLGMQNMFAFDEIQSLQKQLEQEKTYLTEEIKNTHDFEQMIGTSPLLKQAFVQVQQVAPADATVLVLGETGTGKELIARAVHHQSPRKNRVLVKVNCASLPAQLIESELFGHEKGSFTGAYDRRIGKFELANGGTIFLDEIGELPLELQAKLLRVLQEKEIERLGGKTTIPLDVRIIAATNRNLESEVAEGRFRSDLFYRLNVFPITLPPLRDRPEDIPLLANHFAQKFCKKMGKPFMGIRENAMMELMAYDWPGNIRELENIVEQAVIISQGSSLQWARPLTPTRAVPKALSPRLDGFNGRGASLPSRTPVMPAEEDIISILRQTKGRIVGKGGAAEILRMRPSQLEEIERNYLILVLQDTNGRIRGAGGAAEKLDVKPTTLEARIRRLGITKKEIY
jgi:transcriptional regulator with GAF, ATPase, and Fis domain